MTYTKNNIKAGMKIPMPNGMHIKILAVAEKKYVMWRYSGYMINASYMDDFLRKANSKLKL